MAISPAAQAAAHSVTLGPNPLLRLVTTTGTHEVQYTQDSTTANKPRNWQVYEVLGSATVGPLSYEPAVLTNAATTGPGWNTLSIAWYQDQTRWAVPLAASGPANWPRVKVAADRNPPRIPVHQAVVSHIVDTDDRISFDVDPQTVRSHSPVLVQTSYFPNWQAIGADGPWRVTPNLMVVIPTSTHVELHYGFTPVDNAGRLASVAGLAAIGVMWWRERALEVAPDGPMGADTTDDDPTDDGDPDRSQEEDDEPVPLGPAQAPDPGVP
jgi:hypothetical protein